MKFYLTYFTIIFIAFPLYSQEYHPMGDGFNDDVLSLVLHNGEIYAGGYFTASGSTTVNHIARWDGTKWNPLGSGANGGVLALASYKGELYIGGIFTSIGGKPIKSIAKWNGSDFTAVNPTEEFNVMGMMVFKDKLIVGALAGCTYSYDGNEWKNIGCLDGQAMGIYKDELYVSGQSYFSSEWQLRKWVDDNDTTIAISNERILDMAVIGDKLYLGGELDSIDGSFVRKLAVYDGLTYTDLGGGMTGGEEIAALEAYGDRLIVGGYFSSMGGVSANSMAIWDGSRWYALGPGVDMEVQDFLRIGNTLYFAGNFNTLNHIAYLEVGEYSASGVIQGKVFFDSTSNCAFDQNDVPVQHALVRAEPGPYYGVADSSGRYSIFVPPGSYTLKALPRAYAEIICPPGLTHSATIQGDGDTVRNLDFGYYDSDTCADVTLAIAPSGHWWICYDISTAIVCSNLGGNSAKNTTIELVSSPAFTINPGSFTKPSGSGATLQTFGDTCRITIGTIGAGEVQEFGLGFGIKCDEVYHNTWAGITGRTWSDNAICPRAGNPVGISEIGNSLDPNNILVQAQHFQEGAYVLEDTIDSDDELQYIINFQNVGTAPALNITVLDTLPPELDIETFQPLATSHPSSISILGSNIIKWRFDKINLPDSTFDEPGSHGSVVYRIKQKSGNGPGTNIINSASIYFDANSPVKTNLVYNRIPPLEKVRVDTYPSSYVYPNPFSSSARIRFGRLVSNGVFKVTNLQGVVIRETKVIDASEITVERGSLIPGAYYYQVSDATGDIVGSFVVN